MEKQHGEYYTVKRYRLLTYLLNLGFEPEKTLPDPTNYKFCWWIFKNDASLEAEIENYFASLQK